MNRHPPQQASSQIMRWSSRLRIFSVLGLTVLMMLGGCGKKNLSAGDATDQIKTAVLAPNKSEAVFKYDVTANGDIYQECHFSKCPVTYKEYPESLESILILERNGLLTTKLTKVQERGYGGTNVWYSVTLSEAGKKLLQSERKKSEVWLTGKTMELDGIQIIAIGEPADMFGRKVSIVKYKESWKPTALGLALKMPARDKLGEAGFVLYDTGWKLEDK